MAFKILTKIEYNENIRITVDADMHKILLCLSISVTYSTGIHCFTKYSIIKVMRCGNRVYKIIFD